MEIIEIIGSQINSFLFQEETAESIFVYTRIICIDNLSNPIFIYNFERGYDGIARVNSKSIF